jgi:hypothetical protein
VNCCGYVAYVAAECAKCFTISNNQFKSWPTGCRVSTTLVVHTPVRPHPAGRRCASSHHGAPGLSSSPSFHARARSRPLRLPPRACTVAPALAAASPADSSGPQHRTAPLALAVVIALPAEQGLTPQVLGLHLALALHEPKHHLYMSMEYM